MPFPLRGIGPPRCRVGHGAGGVLQWWGRIWSRALNVKIKADSLAKLEHGFDRVFPAVVGRSTSPIPAG